MIAKYIANEASNGVLGHCFRNILVILQTYLCTLVHFGPDEANPYSS